MKTCCHILLLWLALLSFSTYADTFLVVVPARTALTDEFVTHLELKHADDQFIVHSLDQTPIPDAPETDHVITMGVESLRWQLARADNVPIAATYVTRSGLATAGLDDLPARVQVLLANPEPVRQLRLAKLLIPRLRNAALLHSRAYSEEAQMWVGAAEEAEIKLNMATLPSEADLARTLVSVLDRSDVLMGLDDPQVYNADNLKTILLTSYTRDRVLIGPSAPFIAAGSLSTTFSSPADMARSLHFLLTNPATGEKVSYPRFFSVLSNQQVARSMGFAPPDDVSLARELARMEGTE